MGRILKHVDDYFLFIILLCSIFFVYSIFKPFIGVILLSSVFALWFYPVHKKILEKVRGKKNIAAFLTMTLFLIVIVVPLSNFVVLLSQKSIDTYQIIQDQFTNGALSTINLEEQFTWIGEIQQKYLFFTDTSNFDIKKYILDIAANINVFLIESTADFIKGTTAVITQFLLMILTMFFLFRDGELLLTRIMHITPLANTYDKEIFDQFHKISVSTISSSLIIAVIQGVIGAIGFMLIGVPSFFLGVAMAFGSLIPFVGTMIVWLPAALVLFATGSVAKGFVILAWGAILVSGSDNVLRAFMIKGETPIHPLLVFFSVIGGIASFGFVGIIFGPVILAVFLTILHIYEQEYAKVLK